MALNYIIIDDECGKDYNALDNKPSVNDVTLVGNKSLEDLGILPALAVAVYDTTDFEDILAALSKGRVVIARKDSLALPLAKVEFTDDEISKLTFSGTGLVEDVLTFHQITVDANGWSYTPAIIAREEAGTTFATL